VVQTYIKSLKSFIFIDRRKEKAKNGVAPITSYLAEWFCQIAILIPEADSWAVSVLMEYKILLPLLRPLPVPVWGP
jgi:hypothetical protein